MTRNKKLTKDQKRKKVLAARKAKERAEAAKELAAARRQEVIDARLELFRHRLEQMWSPDKVEAMSTEAIITKLAELGVTFDKAAFADAVQRSYSSDRVYRDLWQEKTRHIEGPDGDFPWCAAAVLWERLHPDIPSESQIDNQVEAGYEAQPDDLGSRDEGAWAETFRLWSEACDSMRRRLPDEVRSEQRLDNVHGGM